MREVEVNDSLRDSNKLAKMSSFVAPYSTSMPPVIVDGEELDFYSYILLPFSNYGTLFDLVKKVQERNLFLSIDLTRYLFRMLVEAVDELTNSN